MGVLSTALLILTALGTLYYVASTLALVGHFRKKQPQPSPDFHPSVSVLKPVSGLDAHAHRNFLTYLKQDYPDYEVVFGVLELDDPAISLIRSIVEDTPRAALHIGSRIDGSNNKVRILHTLAGQATREILVITDADTWVSPSFLSAITAPFSDGRVGAVTCLYRGIETKSAADALEGLHMSCVFAPGVACAEALGGIDFGLGAAIAIRRKTLDEIGGFEPIADYLADDFQLGRRAALAGYKVALSHYVMSDVLTGESMSGVLAREQRWSRTTAVSRPWGHFGLFVTYGFTYAVAFCAASRFSPLGWCVLLGVGIIRAATAYAGARSMGDADVARRLYLLPIRDLLSFLIWAAGYFSRSVRWRGRTLKLMKDGTMAAVEDRKSG